MRDNNKNIRMEFDKDLVYIIDLLKKIWSRKKFLAKVSLTFIVIGIIIALTSPISYQSHTIFVPQTSDQSSTSAKGLGSLASLAGINLNAEASSSLDNYISPLLYSKIVDSDEFSMKLINEKLVFENGKSLSVKDYLLSSEVNYFNPLNLIYKILKVIQKYTIGLFTKNEKNQEINDKVYKDYYIIDDEDYNLIKGFRQKFLITANKKEGFIQVTANDKNPLISTQLVKLITENLQSDIISLRTNKIREQLEYSKEQYLKKKTEFEKLQNDLAKFKDSNKNISTALFLSELQKLESDYQLQQSLLMSLANEYNRNKIKLNKNTPIFSVLDEVSVPNTRSKPKRKKIVLIWASIGIISSIIYILLKETLINIFNLIKED